jgi:hypothetical protein
MAAGNLKLKSALIHDSENPGVFKGFVEGRHLVRWKQTKKGCITRASFQKQFYLHFSSALKIYISKSNLTERGLPVFKCCGSSRQA